MNKTLKEIRRRIRDAREGVWYIGKPESFYKEIDNVKYKMIPAFNRGYYYDDSWYLNLGYNYVVDYEKESDVRTLDFSFLDIADIIKMGLKDDVDKVILKSSNIRYANFDIDDDYNSDIPVNIEIMVDTGVIDTRDSIKEFINNNKSICEKDCSLVVKGVTSDFSKLLIMKSILSSEIPNMNVSFNNKVNNNKPKKYINIR